ncbi:hypothetical protein F4801DRAFT_79367 [Xylaria longipes]|nr:hypothetical protein F4801DRAFT_79367 [Xylaria longipes]
MRCATCAALCSDDLISGRCIQIHDNVRTLKASAGAGCDFCTLCWTRCVQCHDEKGLGYLLRGLNSYRMQVKDKKVYLRGLLSPSRPHMYVYEGLVTFFPNGVYVVLGQKWDSIGHLSIFADPATLIFQFWST